MRPLVFLAVMLSLLLGACASGPGQGWGELSGIAEIGLDDIADRERDDGSVLTKSSYALFIEKLELNVDSIVFSSQETIGGGGGDIEFDPANPPPGYSLCHNGHCHAEDGSLPSYEEIEASLNAAGGVVTTPLVTVEIDQSIALLDGATFVISEETCENGCYINEQTEIAEVSVKLARLRAQGKVYDLAGVRLPASGANWSFDIELGAASLQQAMAVPVNADSEPIMTTSLDILVSPKILDGIDWSTTITDPTLKNQHETILEALAESVIEITIQ